MKTNRLRTHGGLPRHVCGTLFMTLLVAVACKTTFRNYDDLPPDATGGEGGDNGAGGNGQGETGGGGMGGDENAPDPICVGVTCTANASCEAADGAPTCACDDGYEEDGDACVDIDECEEESDECDGNALCENLPGSFSCTCKEGFFGDGQWCRPRTELVTVGIGGEPGNGTVWWPNPISISEDGRYVSFAASASNLVAGDTNETYDVFVRDMLEGETVRVSVSSTGVESNGSSLNPGISADGRYVVFESEATNLVPGDTNNRSDIFIRDLVEGTTRRVSVGPNGIQADATSMFPSISANGQFVAFSTSASNIAPFGTWNSGDQVVLRDIVNDFAWAISVDDAGNAGTTASHAASVSSDGSKVAFATAAANLPGGDMGSRIVVVDRSVSPRVLVHAS